jgi:glycerophosphoryl diester phosphodiesterase
MARTGAPVTLKSMDPSPHIAVHGHRGARALLPENTIAGFLCAIEAGADFIELDVVVTVDDVLVVSHDPLLNRRVRHRPCGSRIIRELTFEQVRLCDCGSCRNHRFRRQVPVPGAHIPALDEVFALAGRGPFQFNVELKSFPQKPWLAPAPERLASLLLGAIERHALASRVLMQSFDIRVLRAMGSLAPHIRLSVLDELGARNFVALARRSGTRIVGPYHRLVTERRVAAAHNAGVQVVSWTANQPRDWARLIRAGVDGIITDDPAGLVAYLESTGLRPPQTPQEGGSADLESDSAVSGSSSMLEHSAVNRRVVGSSPT